MPMSSRPKMARRQPPTRSAVPLHSVWLYVWDTLDQAHANLTAFAAHDDLAPTA